jgi:hypothetical protein
MDEELTPDFTTDDLDELASDDQKYMLDKLKPFGWSCTHLWEMEKGVIVLWVIAHPPATQIEASEFTHGYITPEGQLVRYNKGRR